MRSARKESYPPQFRAPDLPMSEAPIIKMTVPNQSRQDLLRSNIRHGRTGDEGREDLLKRFRPNKRETHIQEGAYQRGSKEVSVCIWARTAANCTIGSGGTGTGAVSVHGVENRETSGKSCKGCTNYSDKTGTKVEPMGRW